MRVLVNGSFRIYIHPVSIIGQTIPAIFTMPISGFCKTIVVQEKFAAQNGSVPFAKNEFIAIGAGRGVTGTGAGTVVHIAVFVHVLSEIFTTWICDLEGLSIWRI